LNNLIQEFIIYCMENPSYIEEEFIKFYDSADFKILLSKEIDACNSFYNLCVNGDPFTEKQASYMKFILKKYSSGSNIKLDFKRPFRTIDNSRMIFLQEEKDFQISICFRFPYEFLTTFTDELDVPQNSAKGSVWDPENKVRKIDLYRFDLLKIVDFANRHGFSKDRKFLELESQLQQAINDQDQIVPCSILINDQVELKNADKISLEYYQNNKKNVIPHDSLLAKTMGFPFSVIKKDRTPVEQIASSREQFFWIKNINDYFDLVRQIDTKTCIVMDRNEKEKTWLKDFVDQVRTQIPNKKIKVCFRENQDQDSDFNRWIKENHLGGTVDQGDIFIFQHKPPKWIFKDNMKMLFIATTMITPPSNTVTQDFFSSHPCVLYLGDITPTAWRNRQIVNL
jgi:hypothetical protein